VFWPFFCLPGKTGSCPKTSLRTICTGSSAGRFRLPRSSQTAFESKDTSKITLEPPAVRQVWPQVVPTPKPGRVVLRKSNQTTFANTSGMPLELSRSPPMSEDKQHAIALKETVTPITCLTGQCCSTGRSPVAGKILWRRARTGLRYSQGRCGRSTLHHHPKRVGRPKDQRHASAPG
jgi:hypothetical protein